MCACYLLKFQHPAAGNKIGRNYVYRASDLAILQRKSRFKHIRFASRILHTYTHVLRTVCLILRSFGVNAQASSHLTLVTQPASAALTQHSDGKFGRTVSSTYVHECVDGECGIAGRSDRTRCTRYLLGVESNSLHSTSQDQAAGNKLFRNIRTTTRYTRIFCAKECRN